MSELPTKPLSRARAASDRKHVEDRLDEAVEESFPASDPPAVTLHDDPPKKPRTANEPLPGQPAKQGRE